MIEYILILIAAVAAGISGIIISKNIYGNNIIHGKIKNRYDTYITTLEIDNKKLQGKLNKMKENISIKKEDFDESNPLGSIGTLISKFAPMLPPNLQPLLQSPQAMGFIEKMVKDNPEKVSELIGKFVKSPKGKTADVTPDMESV
jgi:hypothetical protein|tara:strand:- start:73 stop:507 length:435 start_codon:yes stop_codon:yes gene_type:complete